MKFKFHVSATGGIVVEVEANSLEEAEKKVEADFDRILKEEIDLEIQILGSEEAED